MLQTCGRRDSAALYETVCCYCSYHSSPAAGQQQLKKAFFQSFDQEFRPDIQNIQKLGEEVKDEIALAKALIDRQDQHLQELERVAASKGRSILQNFIPKVKNELGTIKELQIQQSSRRSSQYFLMP